MDTRQLYRSRQDRMIAGVCGGIADYLEVDPTLVRLVFVALTLLGGPGLLFYIVLMLIMPKQTHYGQKAKREGFGAESSIIKSSIPVVSDLPE